MMCHDLPCLWWGSPDGTWNIMMFCFFLIFTNCIHVSMCVLTDTASGLYRSQLVWCCSSLGWFAGWYDRIGLCIGNYTDTTCNNEQIGLVYKMKVMVIHGPVPVGAALISDSRQDTRKSCKTTDMGMGIDTYFPHCLWQRQFGPLAVKCTKCPDWRLLLESEHSVTPVQLYGIVCQHPSRSQ